jgi:hypothetical protein
MHYDNGTYNRCYPQILDKRIETFLQGTSHQPTKYFSPPTNKNPSITILAKEK